MGDFKQVTIHFFTIVLDGLPWMAHHYPVFRQLSFPWHWHIVEGVAANRHDTKWCKKIPARLSNDGTTQYIDSIAWDDRISIYRKKLWDGKREMVNTPLLSIKEKCLLWEVDSDEVWRADQIERMRVMFIQEPKRTSAQFYCRYFFGPNIVACDPGKYGNRHYDWHRVWRFNPGMRFEKHEPPIMTGGKRDFRFTQNETFEAGLVFDHFAYATSKTVAFKQAYYQGDKNLYANATEEWDHLQNAKKFPLKLSDYLSWVDDDATAFKI